MLLARARYLKATNRSLLDLWSPAAVSAQRLDEQHVLCHVLCLKRVSPGLLVQTKNKNKVTMTGGNSGASEEVIKDTEEVEKLNLTEWARDENHLSRPTTLLLTKEECASKEALAVLTAGDVMSMDLPLGQRRLLQAAIRKLGRTEPATPTQPPTEPQPGTSNANDEAAANLAPTGEAAPLSTTTDAALSAGDTAGEAGAKIADLRAQAAALQQAGETFDSMFANISPTPTPLSMSTQPRPIASTPATDPRQS